MRELIFTGERLIPGIQGDLVNEHLHRYAFAIDFVKDKKVLDIACGEGYGANLLSSSAKLVSGVDVNEEVILKAQEKYLKPNLVFKQGRAEKIPYPDNSFDVVVSFETIEHLNSQDSMIREIYRVLTHDGVLLISSPDKETYSDSRDYKNEFHEKELYAYQFIDLIKSSFPWLCVFGQETLCSSVIYPLYEGSSKVLKYTGGFDMIEVEQFLKPKFIVIVASKTRNSLSSFVSFFSSDRVNIASLKRDFSNVEKFKESFRYKLANVLLYPWDLLKRINFKVLL